MKYTLIGQSAVPEPDMLAWAAWFETAERAVAKTRVGADLVSTVFLGLDHNFSGAGPPVLFETIVVKPGDNPCFPWKSANETWRCSTWLEAEAQHARVVREWSEKMGTGETAERTQAMPLTQSDLNGAMCMIPGCDHADHGHTLFFHGKCHPYATVSACYVQPQGIIVIRCHRCNELVAELKVAE